MNILYKYIKNGKKYYVLDNGSSFNENQTINKIISGKISNASVVTIDGNKFVRGKKKIPLKSFDNTDLKSEDKYFFRREVYSDLLDWKNYTDKVLLLSGARQVGKTFIIKKFGSSEFKNVYYVNLMENKEFINNLESIYNMHPVGDTDRVYLFLQSYFNGFVDSKDSLIIIDEIQESAFVYNRARFFHRNFSTRFVFTGSFMHMIRYNEGFNESTGDVRRITLNSLNYREYLDAIGLLKDCLSLKHISKNECTKKELIIYSKLEEAYNVYLQLGGYPSIIISYLESGIKRAKEDLKDISVSYLHENRKYIENIIDYRLVEESIIVGARQLLNGKVNYELANKKINSIRENTGSERVSKKEVSDTFIWLFNSNILFQIPIIDNLYSLSSIIGNKLYFTDLGFLNYFRGIDSVLNSSEKGNLIENFVALYLNSHKNIYNESYNYKNNNLEIDFVSNRRIAIEVKFGNGDTFSSDVLLKNKKIDAIIKLVNRFGGVNESGNKITFPIFALPLLDKYLEGVLL